MGRMLSAHPGRSGTQADRGSPMKPPWRPGGTVWRVAVTHELSECPCGRNSQDFNSNAPDRRASCTGLPSTGQGRRGPTHPGRARMSSANSSVATGHQVTWPCRINFVVGRSMIQERGGSWRERSSTEPSHDQKDTVK